MKYLIDTNVWLELLLEQQKSREVQELFQRVESDLFSITEFSLYSIGVILTKLNKDEIFKDFISDTIEYSGVRLIRLNSADIKQLLSIRKQYHLDFDDAYQYFASEKYNLIIVSFDRDFDNTRRGRKEPAEIVK